MNIWSRCVIFFTLYGANWEFRFWTSCACWSGFPEAGHSVHLSQLLTAVPRARGPRALKVPCGNSWLSNPEGFSRSPKSSIFSTTPRSSSGGAQLWWAAWPKFIFIQTLLLGNYHRIIKAAGWSNPTISTPKSCPQCHTHLKHSQAPAPPGTLFQCLTTQPKAINRHHPQFIFSLDFFHGHNFYFQL